MMMIFEGGIDMINDWRVGIVYKIIGGGETHSKQLHYFGDMFNKNLTLCGLEFNGVTDEIKNKTKCSMCYRKLMKK